MTHVNPAMPAVEQTKPLFSQLGIAPKILEVLERAGFKHPTPIQHQAIPPALDGKDVVGIAQTGTGKTLAFGVPMIQRLARNPGQGLVIVPTRELALQVEETLRKVGGPLGLKTAVLIGGASMFMQVKMLRNRPHVIVATPGRLADHLEQKNLTLNEVKIAVLDEADRMFDIGFAPQIKKILALVPKERQTMLFSATMPPEIAALAGAHMRLPLRIEVAPQGTSASKVEQEVIMVPKEMKLQLLDKVLTENQGTVLIFSRTKYGAKKIAANIRNMGITAVEMHSNRSLAQRKEALQGFKTGRYRALVATDIAARGIDVTGIALVINFDLPQAAEDYVHRIGRTARAGQSGKAISFASPDQRNDVRQIERLIRKTLPMLPTPVLPPRRAGVITHVRDDRFGGNGGHMGHSGHNRAQGPRGSAPKPFGGQRRQSGGGGRRFGRRP